MTRWRSLLMVGAGGLVGSGARALLGLVASPTSGGFPTQVLLINLSGSFLIGFLWARWERIGIGTISVQFLAIGMLGSFTTFSAFAVEVVELLNTGRLMESGLYVASSLAGGLALALVGQRVGAGVG